MLIRVLILGISIEDIIPSKINFIKDNIDYEIIVSDLNTRYDTDTADIHIMYTSAGNAVPMIPTANVINIPEYDKLQQYIFLRDHNIPTPVGIRYVKDYHSRTLAAGNTISNDTPVMVRSMAGADGVGMFRIPYDVLNSALSFITKHNNDIVGFKKAYSAASISPTLKNTIVHDPNLVFVTEYLTNVKNEYRVAVIGDNITIYKRNRTVKDNELIQANINKDIYFNLPTTYTMVNDEYDITPSEDMLLDLDLSEKKYIEILSLTRFIIKHLPMLYGSLDFYIRDNGEVGIFEFSNQFGTSVVPTTTTIRYHVEFIKKIVLEYLENATPTYLY